MTAADFHNWLGELYDADDVAIMGTLCLPEFGAGSGRGAGVSITLSGGATATPTPSGQEGPAVKQGQEQGAPRDSGAPRIAGEGPAEARPGARGDDALAGARGAGGRGRGRGGGRGRGRGGGHARSPTGDADFEPPRRARAAPPRADGAEPPRRGRAAAAAAAAAAARAALPPPGGPSSPPAARRGRGRPPKASGRYSKEYLAVKHYRERRRTEQTELAEAVASKLAEVELLTAENQMLRVRELILQETLSGFTGDATPIPEAVAAAAEAEASVQGPAPPASPGRSDARGGGRGGGEGPSAPAGAGAGEHSPAGSGGGGGAHFADDDALSCASSTGCNAAAAGDEHADSGGARAARGADGGADGADGAGSDTDGAVLERPLQPLHGKPPKLRAVAEVYREYIRRIRARIQPDGSVRPLHPWEEQYPPPGSIVPLYMSMSTEESLELLFTNLVTGEVVDQMPDGYVSVAARYMNLRPEQEARIGAALDIFFKGLDKIVEERAQLQQQLDINLAHGRAGAGANAGGNGNAGAGDVPAALMDSGSSGAAGAGAGDAALAAAASGAVFSAGGGGAGGGGGSPRAAEAGAGPGARPAAPAASVSVGSSDSLMDLLLRREEILSKLHRNMVKEDRMCSTMAFMLFRMLDEVQRGTCILHCWPFVPRFTQTCAIKLGRREMLSRMGTRQHAPRAHGAALGARPAAQPPGRGG